MPYTYQSGNVYRRGDYYRGDYYRGDPGIFGTIAKGIGGFITGGPIGAVAAVAGSILKRPAPPTGTAIVPFSPGGQLPVLQEPFQPGFGVQTGGLRIGMFGPQTKEGQMIAAGGPLPPTMRGMHYNKSTYETRGGGTSRWGPSGSLQIHPKGSVLVRSRRMNVGNARALKRALRRARGFERLARSVMHVRRVYKSKPTKRAKK